MQRLIQPLRLLSPFIYLYLLTILLFFIFRLVLFGMNTANLNDAGSSLIATAFMIGLRFDTTIICYIFFVPVFIYAVLTAINICNKWALRIIYIFCGTLFSLAFLISTADIPFFNQFFVRFNNTAFLWKEDAGMAMTMILKEQSFYLFFFLFLAVECFFIFFLRMIYRYHRQLMKKNNYSTLSLAVFIPFMLLVCVLIFLGIRGRLDKRPLHDGEAYYCDNAFLNQLGLNPVFVLGKSLEEAAKPENALLQFMPDEDALRICAADLHADPDLKAISPIARRQSVDDLFKGRNIVMVIMESMSTAKMGRYGNTDNLTPFLDSLAAVSWSFDNIYTSGIHTFNGVYTTMFAHPALMERHSMRSYLRPVNMAGFPNILSQHGYQTIFFTTHDEHFDNMSGFLSNNSFQRVIGERSYPSAEIRNHYGVSDYFMFNYALPMLSELHNNGAPFFSVLLTCSDHPPYSLDMESGFKPRSNEIRKQATEFADWALQDFMQKAAKEDWFDNTVFVFIADHGCLIDGVIYDIMLSYHHSPFIIYAPDCTAPLAFPCLGLQSDVFPTVMAHMGIPFVNNTFGIDLLTEQHEYIVFSSDDKLAAMTDSLLYIYRKTNPDGLYRYRENSVSDDKTLYPLQYEYLKTKAFSWLQTSQYMLENNKTALK